MGEYRNYTMYSGIWVRSHLDWVGFQWDSHWEIRWDLTGMGWDSRGIPMGMCGIPLGLVGIPLGLGDWIGWKSHQEIWSGSHWDWTGSHWDWPGSIWDSHLIPVVFPFGSWPILEGSLPNFPLKITGIIS